MANQTDRQATIDRAALNRVARARKAKGCKADPRAAPRPFGTMRGQIWLAPDFDHTPEDLIAIMETGIEPASSE